MFADADYEMSDVKYKGNIENNAVPIGEFQTLPLRLSTIIHAPHTFSY
jgi:hypothetical protein